MATSSPLLGQVERDLRAGIAATHHQRAFAAVGRGVLVNPGVNRRPLKAVEPRNRRQLWYAVVTGGHDDDPRCHHAGARIHGELVAAAFDGVHGNTEAGCHLVRRRIRLQVCDHLFARRVARRILRPRHHGEPGISLGGVQMQPVVVPVPGAREPLLALEHHVSQALAAQTRGRRETRRAGANNQDVFRRHRPPLRQALYGAGSGISARAVFP
jgi:hypothetical protein